jgi:hypothetical protein
MKSEAAAAADILDDAIRSRRSVRAFRPDSVPKRLRHLMIGGIGDAAPVDLDRAHAAISGMALSYNISVPIFGGGAPVFRPVSNRNDRIELSPLAAERVRPPALCYSALSCNPHRASIEADKRRPSTRQPCNAAA